MSSSGAFSGVIRIDGKELTNRVSVFISNIEAVISDSNETIFAKKRISLRPFSPEMLSRASAAQMKAGLLYTIKGNLIGAYTYGPLGHPGDGEYDHWPLKEFFIEAKYSSSLLTVGIQAATALGSSGLDRTAERTFAPLSIEIEFRVPSSEMVQFLQIPSGPDKYFKEKLALCG